MARAFASTLLLVVVLASHPSAQSGAANGPPPGEGRELLTAACAQCHGLNTIMAMRDGPAGWRLLVFDMILRGAQLNRSEAETVIAYLAKQFGPGVPLVRSGDAAVTIATLPPAPGRELVGARCTLCHGVDRLVAVKRTSADWDGIVKNMVARGPAVPENEVQQIARYLKEQFGR